MSARTGEAEWLGTLHDGAGRLTVGPQRWSAPYTFASRFGDEPDTNPEELIAAAHAGCFAMALCHVLTQAGHPPESVATGARVHLRLVDGTPTIQRIDLTARVRAPGLTAGDLGLLAETAKAGCAVSRALTGVPEIVLDAELDA
jgi:osmotically inducible protein OsmC